MTTVHELFEHAGVPYAGVVAWGDPVSLAQPGVYVVSTSRDPDVSNGPEKPPLNLAAIDALLAARPEATVDKRTATPELLAGRLRSMWPSGESIVYVGLAGTSTEHRVEQYYRTVIGARAPHAGGWPVKMLDPSTLWVHYGATQDPDATEKAMIRRFVSGVPANVARTLIDTSAPLPFANFIFPAGRRKAHGLRGVKEARTRGAHDRVPVTPDKLTSATLPTLPALRDSRLPTPDGATRRTQNITSGDLDRGQIRVPRESKSIFPTAKTRIEVELGNETFDVSWDPRTEGANERSGVIRVGKEALSRYISAGGPRTVEVTSTGFRIT